MKLKPLQEIERSPIELMEKYVGITPALYTNYDFKYILVLGYV